WRWPSRRRCASSPPSRVSVSRTPTHRSWTRFPADPRRRGSVKPRWCSAVLAALILAAGCAHQDAPGVDALVVQTDLAFGIAQAGEKPTPPPNVLAPLQPIGDGEEAFTPPSLPPNVPVPACRAAGLTD